MNRHLFPYEWKLSDGYPAIGIEPHGATAFSCFACGGGSTMGYKLAGFDVIGCNEIDPKMVECYKANHHPKHCFVEAIQTFKDRDDLPKELFDLDILDGSPPCSSFSMAGNREKDWGKEKKFREGQAEQVLDTLFFDFIDLAKKLQPKSIVAENVKGLILGEAQLYVDKILKAYDEAGYYVDFKLLDSALMGVPQRRRRVFFYAIRKDIYAGGFADLYGTRPKLKLSFSEKPITFGELNISYGKEILKCYREDWERLKKGEPAKYMQSSLVPLEMVHPTVTAGYQAKASPMPENRPYWLCGADLCLVGAYPGDYNFCGKKASYVIGMSVPPVMMAHVAHAIKTQWLDNLKKEGI